MIVGLPKEIKNNENRVGLVPAGVKALTSAGHKVFVEHDAGAGIRDPRRGVRARGRAGSSRRPTRCSRRPT